MRLKSLRFLLDVQHTVGVNLIPNVSECSCYGATDRKQIARVKSAWVEDGLRGADNTIGRARIESHSPQRITKWNSGRDPFTCVNHDGSRNLASLFRRSMNFARECFVGGTPGALHMNQHTCAGDCKYCVNRNM